MAKSAEYQVIVCGGGPAGCAAAISAGRGGCRTLLVEETGMLGGVGGPGGVSHWLGGRSRDCSTFVVGGIFESLVREAAAEGIAILPEVEEFSPFGWGSGPHHLTAGVPFDHWRMAEFLDRKVLEAGVDICFFTRFIGAECHDGRITGITLHNKSGLTHWQPRLVIDATGDADVAAAAGCDCSFGTPEGLTAPASLEFRVSGVDTGAMRNYIREHQAGRFLVEIGKLRSAGQWPFPYDRFISVRMVDRDMLLVNTVRLVGVNGTDGKSLSDAMIRGRREIMALFEIMKKYFPGFKNSRIADIATIPGIRESRRISSGDTLTVEDILRHRQLEDIIGYCCYGWDLPDPERPSLQHFHGRVAAPEYFPLPFHIMKPHSVTNLLCPGRAVDAEREVLGAIRVMASCMAMGEAAGTAATLTEDFTQLPIEKLKQRLTAAGCRLASPEVLPQ